MKKFFNKIFTSLYKINFRRAFLIGLILQLTMVVYVWASIVDFINYKNLMLNVHSEFLDEYKINLFDKENLTMKKGIYVFLTKNIKKDFIKYTANRPPKNSKLETFYIAIDKKHLEKLNSNLPKSGTTESYTAFLKTDNSDVKKIKLRYRGDTPGHWAFEKKSLRISMQGEDTYNLEKKFNLIVPPNDYSIIDIVNYETSKKLGIISPDCFPVRVYLNGKYMGVYFYLSQVDESLLRKHKLMPGSIYYGDGCPTDPDKTYKTTTLLWQDPSYWEKKAARNSEQKSDVDEIKYFIKAISSFNDIDFYDFAETYLNKDKFYNYLALDVITGTPHHDYHHNYKLYFDPYKGLFEPIEWDIRWWTDAKSKDESYYELLKRIKLNPILEGERDKVAYKLLSDGIVEKMVEKTNDYKEALIPELKADIYKNNYTSLMPFDCIPYSIKEFVNSVGYIENGLLERKKYLIYLYNNISSRYYVKNTRGSQAQLLFEIDGNSPVQVDFAKNYGRTAKIYRDTNFNGVIDKEDVRVKETETLYPGRKEYQGLESNGEKFVFYARHHLKPHPLYYSYIVIGDIEKNGNLKAENAITGRNIKIQYKKFKQNKIKADSIHPWELPVIHTKKVVLKGNIEVKKTLEFDKNTTITILPGTTFTMHPRQSIYFYGKVNAEGSKHNPIRFIAKNKSRPWGIVAVQGQSASGSKFKYVEFKDGSVDSRRLIQYTAPFNIHNLKDFELSHIKVGKNHTGDDAMHISYSNGVLKDSVFVNAKSDALDIDIADVEIKNTIFINSGNDSVDLMTANAEIENCIFINSGDKGISTGEWSVGNYKNNFFYNNLIAVEVKDKSNVKMEKNIVVNSREKAINLYNKNTRYDEGGLLDSDKLYIIGNNKISHDKRSKVKATNTNESYPEFSNLNFLNEKLLLNNSFNSLDYKIKKVVKSYEN